MFNSDVIFTGKHAFYINELVSEHKVFNRNIDVLLAAPFIGYHFNSQEEPNNDEEYKKIVRTINNSQLSTERSELVTIYRLLLLLENSSNRTPEERIDQAFRVDSDTDLEENHKNNVKLFYSYVRGGISILYEKLVQDADTREDVYENIRVFVKDFQLDHSDNLEELNEQLMF